MQYDEISPIEMRWGEVHDDGVVFYDAHGSKFLCDYNNKIHKLGVAGAEVADLMYHLSPNAVKSKPAATMCGEGAFHRISMQADPREMNDIGYRGDMIYNMDADADLGYLIIKNSSFSNIDEGDVLRIRGNLKKIAIVCSSVTDIPIKIISNTNPEIFIIGSYTSNSSIEVVNDQGVPYDDTNVVISGVSVSNADMESILSYVRRDDSLDTQDDVETTISSTGIGMAACLAVAGIAAVLSSKSSHVISKESKVYV